MPISGCWRLRHEIFHAGQQSPRWGIVDQLGKLSDTIIDHVFHTITAGGNGLPVRAAEEPVVLVVPMNRKTTLVHEGVML